MRVWIYRCCSKYGGAIFHQQSKRDQYMSFIAVQNPAYMYLVYTSKIKALEVIKKLDVKMSFIPPLKSCTFIIISVIFIFLYVQENSKLKFQSTLIYGERSPLRDQCEQDRYDVFNARKILINHWIKFFRQNIRGKCKIFKM